MQASRARNLCQSSDDGKVGNSSGFVELFVDHKSQKTHLGGTAVVQFNGTLGKLGLLIKSIPSEVKGSVTEVTNEVSWGGTVGAVLHDTQLQSTNEGNNLEKSSTGDGIRSDSSGNSVGEAAEGVTSRVNVSWKVDSGTGGDLSEESKHTDTSVPQFNITKAVELLFISVDNAKRIPNTKWWLGSQHTSLSKVEVEDGGGLSLLG